VDIDSNDQGTLVSVTLPATLANGQ
jgi:hypothetical protein